MASPRWRRLGVTSGELVLSRTLPVGQSFGWRRHTWTLDRGDCVAESVETWRGVIGRRAFELRQADDGEVYYRYGGAAREVDMASKGAFAKAAPMPVLTCTPPTTLMVGQAQGEEEDVRRMLSSYFRLDRDYLRLHETFKSCDARYNRLADYTIGCRTLELDPLECLLSFICSSNNNIARISKMVDFLRWRYGDPVLDLPWSADVPNAIGAGRANEKKAKQRKHGQHSSVSEVIDTDSRWCYTFPTLRQLECATEEDLRKNGFGYRAKFIVGTIKMLNEGGPYRDIVPLKSSDAGSMSGEDWLLALRRCQEKRLVTDALEKLPGIGPKVARCVSLFSLDDNAAIPVDTHVWQITEKYYADLLLAELRLRRAPAVMPKTVTPKIMEVVEVVFRKVFGEYAGWAHNALFIAELPIMQQELPEDLRVVKKTPVKKARGDAKGSPRGAVASPTPKKQRKVDIGGDEKKAGKR